MRVGQAVARVLGWAGRMVLVAAGLALVGGGVLAVRLAHGPVPVTGLVRHFAGRRLTVGAATVVWDRQAPQSPLMLTLTTPMVRRDDGSVLAQARAASVAVLVARLLIGQIRPVLLTADDGGVALRRAIDGTLGLDTGAPARTGGAPTRLWRRLRRVTLRGIAITMRDPSLGVWQGRVNALDVVGIDEGRLLGSADLTLTRGDQTGTLTARLSPYANGSGITGQIGALIPARLGIPASSAVDLPVSAGFWLTLDRAWHPAALTADLRFGAGRVLAAGGAIPVAGGTARIDADASGRRARLTAARVALAGGPVLTASGSVAWAGARANALLAIDCDHVALAGLGRYWPPLVAKGGRAWITANVTAGTASAIHVALGLAIEADAMTLTQAQGQLRIEDATVAWLSPVPPLLHAAATVTLISPDALSVAIPHVVQSPTDPASAPLLLSGGTLRITGLAAAHQIGVVDGDVAGPVAQAVALLREPRLHLLAAHPVELGAPSGTLHAHVHLSLPLEDAVTVEQIPIRATGRLDDLRLGGIVAGEDLNAGALSLEVTNDGLKLAGTATLAGVPATIAVAQDFRAGPLDQVVGTYNARGFASAAQLQSAGLLSGGLVDGTVAYAASLAERRGGAGTAQAHLDLHGAALRLAALGWEKPAGTDAFADAEMRLDHDRLVAVDRLSVVGPGMSVQGQATYAAGQAVTLDFNQIVLGQTRASGQVRLPRDGAQPVRATLHGTVLDLSARMKSNPTRRIPGRAEAAAAARQRQADAIATHAAHGRTWTADLHFDTVVMGPGHILADVTARADDDGTLIRHAQMAGTAGKGRFRMTLSPGGNGRVVHGAAADAAGLLHALNLLDDVQGGTLALDAAYDDRQPDHPLTGTATIDRFRVVGAPAMARLLQAMTLYGVMDVLRGPGLGITHLVAPFRFADQVLTLDDARAFSGSLGFTVKGDVDLAALRADLTGTIVPAYFFNTLLGKVPVVGKLFSPEAGGGVFAATYTLAGPLGSPKVAVNPLAALTPGFLRGVFGGGAPADGARP